MSPPQERTGGSFSKRTIKGSHEYRQRRDRNNTAVKRSREKAKERSMQTLAKVERLKEENEMLETKVTILNKELSLLKDLLMSHVKAGVVTKDACVYSELLEKINAASVLQRLRHSTSSASSRSSSIKSDNDVDSPPGSPAVVPKVEAFEPLVTHIMMPKVEAAHDLSTQISGEVIVTTCNNRRQNGDHDYSKKTC